jgi:hypothetical protein
VSGTFPDNPSFALPQTVAASIPDDATFVSPDYVQTQEGDMLSAATGKKVSDDAAEGTQSDPADPLAKTNGKKFIPVSVARVREAMK